ncbi:MAG TPA: septum formation initiator family protein [Thermomicrobiaceae bacterium]|nr:septum formation initiator family protein [Thermomicrobiaceae bacterium]
MSGVRESLADLFARNRGRLVAAIVLVIGLYFVVAFGQQAWKARALETEVAGRQADLASLQAKQDALKSQLAQYQSDQYSSYVEQIARRDLNLSHPGETVILMRLEPAPTPAATPAPATAARPDQQANWMQWLRLFHLR